jgi:hypothetical protein
MIPYQTTSASIAQGFSDSGVTRVYLIVAWPMMHAVRRLERHFGRGRLQGQRT